MRTSPGMVHQSTVQSKPHYEFHLDTLPLTREEARAILELRGTYTECRGHSTKRCIHLPLNARSTRLVTQLIRTHTRFGETTVIIRSLRRLAHFQNTVVIERATSGENAFDRMLNKVRGRFERGELPKPMTAEQRKVQRIANLRRWLDEARETVAKCEAELAALGA